jgi:hypothetical protein
MFVIMQVDTDAGLVHDFGMVKYEKGALSREAAGAPLRGT